MLRRARGPTTLTFTSTIDHHLATNELAARFLEGSAKVVNVPAVLPDAKDPLRPALTHFVFESCFTTASRPAVTRASRSKSIVPGRSVASW
ncbi:MAG: hypothetical protein ABTQ32_21075 [Myxococcaceae bacterium]